MKIYPQKVAAVGAKVISITPEDLVTGSEIAQRNAREIWIHLLNERHSANACANETVAHDPEQAKTLSSHPTSNK